MDGILAEREASAYFLALLHDRAVQPLAYFRGKLVDLVALEDLDGLARGIQSDLAVLAAAQMLLQIGAHLRGHFVVNEVIELGQKLSASHFSPPFFLRK